MNWAVLRREWGAVTFVLTVLAGVILVPLALYLTGVGPSPITTSPVATTSTARASGVASPIPTVSPTASASRMGTP